MLAGANCEVAFDNLTRQLYATDASVYQIEPVAVAFPQDTRQAIAIIEAAVHAGLAIIPRGAGTGLTGGAIGDGVVIDFSRCNRLIWDLDVEKRTVRAGVGVVLDQLNNFLRPHGFCFGPDVATSSRATLGGMIANNSSGAHAPLYGTTVDHLVELDIVTENGRLSKIGPGQAALPQQLDLLESIARFNHLRVADQCPPGLQKRWPGYGLDRVVRDSSNLIPVIAGSEGTLAAVVSAQLKIVPTPDEIGLSLIFFDSAAEAMQAAIDVLDLSPAAVEHMDRFLLDQTRGNREFQIARDLLEFDAQPCASVLAVEFYENVEPRLEALQKRGLGVRRKVLQTLAEITHIWALRKASLSLLTSRKGDAKPVACVEDTAVRPKDLPAYYKELQAIMRRLGLEASYYGHAASGLLHVRPVVDLHSPEGVKKFREVTEEVAALVRQFKGSFCAEHGVGIARTEFLKNQVGDDLYLLMRQIKEAFDPHNLFNPGKIIADGRYHLDMQLRINPGRPVKLPFEPVLAFAGRDESFVRNLEQCNGCGACLKEAPTMCPTFIATGREIMSTRGRANAIRAALELRGMSSDDPLTSPELAEALDNCLSCKACVSECPSNVNLALLKAELHYAHIRRDGIRLRERLFAGVDRFGRWGCKMPWLANELLSSFFVRQFLAWGLGITARRPLPLFSRTRFDHWFAQRQRLKRATRGPVILWDDTFVRYFEPNIGIAAVKVLEAAGFDVALAIGRECCGRPAFSQGHLAKAMRLGRHNLALLEQTGPDIPVLFLEPSCHSMFAEDYLQMKLPGAEQVAARCWRVEEFLDDLLRREPEALRFQIMPEYVAIHAHCHTKALTNPAYLHRLMMRLPDCKVSFMRTGCCGMAGAFGMLDSKYDLSVEVAKPLVEKIHGLPYGTIVVAGGASCRQQIAHLTRVRARHMVEVLAQALI